MNEIFLVCLLQCFLNIVIFMVEGGKTPENTKTETLSDDTSSDEEPVPLELRVTEEEKRGTSPGSVQATAMALMCRRAQANPTVERGKLIKRNKKKNKNPQSKGTQTETTDK